MSDELSGVVLARGRALPSYAQVVFDGTRHRVMGRQLCTEEETPQVVPTHKRTVTLAKQDWERRVHALDGVRAQELPL